MIGEKQFGVGSHSVNAVNSTLTVDGTNWVVTAASPGRFGVSMLVPYFARQKCGLLAALRVSEDQNFRIEICGYATRMQKAYIDFKGTGEISRLGEEIVSANLTISDGSHAVRMDFIPHKTRLEWLFIFCEAKSAGESFRLEKAIYKYHYPKVATRPQECHFSVNSLSLFQNYLQIDFELLDRQRKLAGIRLKGNRAFETVQWWTTQDIGSHPSVTQRPRSLKFPLPSPRAMEAFGPNFGWHGHSIRAIFADFINIPLMQVETSDSILDSLRLEAVFEDGSVKCFPVTSAVPDFPGARQLDQILRGIPVREASQRVFVELGGRGSASSEIRKLVGQDFKYIGVDIEDHPNVDIVADVHQLSEHVALESVDVVYSHSVLEHLIAPWKVVIESNRILRSGGLFIAYAPVTWPLHAEPWDFWRISPHAWPSLLNEATGFEILRIEEIGNAAIVPLDVGTSRSISRMQHDPAPLFSSVVARKIGDSKIDWSGWEKTLAKGKYDQ